MSETRYAVRYIPGTELHARHAQVGEDFPSRQAAEDFRAGCSNAHLLEVTTQPETLPTVTTLPKPTLEDLPDFEAEVLCEACEEDPARWRMFQRPCGHSLAICNDCYETAIALELPASDTVLYGCDRCDSIVTSIDAVQL